MEKNEKILAIIPVYNEERAIINVLEKFVKGVVDEILIVDDGSTDSSTKLIYDFKSEIPINVIRHESNIGVGASLQDGIKYSLERSYDLIVVMAGNGKDDPREIPKLTKPIIHEGYDYIQGSRFIKGGRWDNLPKARWAGIKLYSLIWSKLLGVKLTDVTNGFRAYRTSIFKDGRINIWQDWLKRYELELYIHYKVIKLGYRFKEVPVSKIYPISGKYTKIKPFIDWWRMVKPLIYLHTGIKD